MEAKNSSVNALVYQAAETSSVTNAPLSNVSVAVKDNICTADMPTTCSSRMLKDFTSPFNAAAVELLIGSGATIIGKTNCDEFGMGCVASNYISLRADSVRSLVLSMFILYMDLCLIRIKFLTPLLSGRVANAVLLGAVRAEVLQQLLLDSVTRTRLPYSLS